VFSKKLSKFQQVVFQNNRLFYLSSYEKVLKNLVDFAVKPKQSIVSTKQSIVSTKQQIVFLKTITEFC